MTPTRKNIKLAIKRLNEQLDTCRGATEIFRLEEEITELQKLLTFGTKKEKKWSK